MTKEEIQYEAQSIIQEWGSNDSAPYVEFVEKLASMELPESFSNLDEAAIPESEMSEWMEYGPHTNYPWCSVPDAIKITAEHFFTLGKQAGAEWMAGQGIKLHGRILPGPRCNLYIESDCFDRGYKGLNYRFSDSNDVDMFVQIRKNNP